MTRIMALYMAPVVASIMTRMTALYMAHIVAYIMTRMVIVMYEYICLTQTLCSIPKVEIFKTRMIHKTYKKSYQIL
jgi:hypothetical protein